MWGKIKAEILGESDSDEEEDDDDGDEDSEDDEGAAQGQPQSQMTQQVSKRRMPCCRKFLGCAFSRRSRLVCCSRTS